MGWFQESQGSTCLLRERASSWERRSQNQVCARMVCMPRMEDCEFDDSLDCIIRLCLKIMISRGRRRRKEKVTFYQKLFNIKWYFLP